MRGALLRSGKIADYDALGEAGTPVHRMAEQVREAIRRKQPALITSLAIPQINQAGDSIDWYAPQTGPVIPWSSSTEEERIPARARLEALKAELDTLSTTLLATQAGTPNSDTALFARLLSRVPYFPDESHVYLVDGEPVLTFWGFDRVGADPTRNPLQCLYPAAPVPAAPVPPAVAPATPMAPAAVVAPLPWWKRWWWLLLLPLLLLLLFGLRGCMTTGSLPLPGSPGWPAWMPFGTPALEAPTVQVPALDVTGARVVTGGNTQVLPGAPGGAGLADGVQADGTLSPLTEDPDAALPPTAGPDPDAPGADDAHAGAPPPELPQDGTGPDNTQAAPPPLGNETAPADAPGTQPPALSLPPHPADGPAGFLNGQWRAGAGIQDAQTGKPVRLDYQFKDGQGQVTVTRGSARCQGPVSAAMQSGALHITPSGQASCSDGTQYELPKLECKPGATSAADCAGDYGNTQFPLSMRQTGTSAPGTHAQ